MTTNTQAGSLAYKCEPVISTVSNSTLMITNTHINTHVRTHTHVTHTIRILHYIKLHYTTLHYTHYTHYIHTHARTPQYTLTIMHAPIVKVIHKLSHFGYWEVDGIHGEVPIL